MSESQIINEEQTASLELPRQRPKKRHRRLFTAEQKRQIVQEAYKPGANVSAVARAHNILPNQIFNWRRKLPAQANGKAEPSKIDLLQSLLAEKLSEVEVLKTAITRREIGRASCRERV